MIDIPHQKLALFWGCSIQTRLLWIEVAARLVLPKLGVDIVDLPFSCCPDPVATKALNHLSWLTLAARNLALAEEKKLNMLTLCNGCFETFKKVQHELKSPETKKNVNKYKSVIKANEFFNGTWALNIENRLPAIITAIGIIRGICNLPLIKK